MSDTPPPGRDRFRDAPEIGTGFPASCRPHEPDQREQGVAGGNTAARPRLRSASFHKSATADGPARQSSTGRVGDVGKRQREHQDPQQRLRMVTTGRAITRPRKSARCTMKIVPSPTMMWKL